MGTDRMWLGGFVGDCGWLSSSLTCHSPFEVSLHPWSTVFPVCVTSQLTLHRTVQLLTGGCLLGRVVGGQACCGQQTRPWKVGGAGGVHVIVARLDECDAR